MNKISEQIWKDRYQKNDETYEQNLWRVAQFCSNSDEEREEFFNLMREKKFFPGGRTMSNAGIGSALTLNNCFISNPIPDSLDGIFDAVKLGAATHQRGGGIGYDFSTLRPAGSATSNDAIASGPVSFMNVFNAQTATILQGNRRGANLGALNIYHPDIEEFITAKSRDEKILNHFNLSVMVDDKFMEAVDKREEIELHWPVYDENGFIERNPKNWVYSKKVNAYNLWEKIMQCAYDNGEPGIFFYDNMNRDNNLWYAENIVGSNPCGEYLSGLVYNGAYTPSEYGGACNLGSIMLTSFVENPFTKKAEINYYKLGQTIHTAVRMLDNIIDKNTFPNKIYENYQKYFRTIGLGYTGLADALVMLGYRYDTPEARIFVGELTEFIAYSAYSASVQLAEIKGPFPGFVKEDYIKSNFLNKHRSSSKLDWNILIGDIEKYGIRNAKLLSVAPTGTMSLVFGDNCSSGIEPIFSLEYERRVKIGGQQQDNENLIKVQDYAYKLHQEKNNRNSLPRSLSYNDEIISNPPFVTAMDISVEDHVLMLAAIAYNVDMSVSKTINVPEDYPFNACKDIYYTCWKLGVKGCTIFRPNPLRKGVLIESTKHDTKIVKCKDNLIGIKRKLMTGCGSMHLMAWYDPNTKDILEVFIGRGSSGGCEKNLLSMARLISLSLRGGVPLDKVIDQLESCGGCSAYNARRVTKKDTSPGSSCATAIAHTLLEINNQIRGIKEEEKKQEINGPKCPECGAELTFEGGCNICKSCGWSKCG